MPYIKPEDRNDARNFNANNAGELNYKLTLIIKQYFKDAGGNYQAINDIVGALEGAKLEFYRRVAAPYEDSKIIQNGDVY